MYEDEEKKLNINWKSLIIKLLIFIVVVFFLCWIIAKINKPAPKESNNNYIDNINIMKTAAFEYYTEKKLPKNTGEANKVTLDELINNKQLIDFTKNGKICNTKKSYIQATKASDDEYSLKVNLECGRQKDFIITTIEKKNYTINVTNDNKATINSDKTNNNSAKHGNGTISIPLDELRNK